jgi:peptidoglycan hydrolase CwlO-like protein|tara:strand:- start:14710 stop:15162 length:453 start_codon:yes stop_codon:yes gene_type:complete
MFITLLMVVGLAGAGVYVMKLRSDNAILKANQIQLEQGLEEQKKLLEQQEKDFNAIMESNKKLNALVLTFKKDLDDLDKRFNKKKRDVGKLAIERSKSTERVINKGSTEAKRCVELASGAKHTEAELKATKRSQINPQCPSLANPNYVAY